MDSAAVPGRSGVREGIVFGSDSGLKEEVAASVEAEFLTEQQKQDILCNNAARFLRTGRGNLSLREVDLIVAPLSLRSQRDVAFRTWISPLCHSQHSPCC